MSLRTSFCLTVLFLLTHPDRAVAQTLSGASAHFPLNELTGDAMDLAGGSVAKTHGGSRQGVPGVVALAYGLDGQDDYLNLGRSAAVKPVGAFTFMVHFF